MATSPFVAPAAADLPIDLLRRLCAAPGIAGREDAVRTLLLAEMTPLVDAINVDALGNVPADLMNASYLMLKPFRLHLQKYVGLVDILDDKHAIEDFLRMEKWIFDSPAQAGEAYRKFLKDLYQENKLVKGELTIGDRRVDLKRITMPLLNIYATEDHLVPPASSIPINDLVGSEDKTLYSFPGGHIGIYVSSKSQREFAPKIARWLMERDGPDARPASKGAAIVKFTPGKAARGKGRPAPARPPKKKKAERGRARPA